jgi:ATP-dependent DNA ligase
LVGFAGRREATVPEGSERDLSYGLRREGEALVYLGRVGTGWDPKTAAAIRRTLAALARHTCPLAKPIKRVAIS